MKIYKFLFPAVFIAVSTAGAGKSWANSDDEYCREFTKLLKLAAKKKKAMAPPASNQMAAGR